MHIPDGILTGPMIIMWYIIAAVFIAIGARVIVKKRKENPQVMSILALMGAAVFIISVWHIPVAVAGSSGHPTGTGLAAIIIGPFPTVVITAIAIFFQVFLGHGGITTIGANTVSMGVVGAFSGYAVYWVARKVGGSYWVSAALGGFVGDMLTYATTAFQLALNQSYTLYQSPSYLWPYFTLYMAEFSIVQVPIAIIEAAFTAITIQYIVTHKPEILKWWQK
jgi:cobalt/nickel transport system permease protein